jgi:uncharacterized protein (TIGR03435 family)
MLLAFAHAQPSFEVASVKPIPPGPKNDQSPFAEKIDAHPGSVSMRNVRIRTCIKWAYDLKNYEISGVDPLAPEHYNIMAKAEEGTPVSESPRHDAEPAGEPVQADPSPRNQASASL